MADHPNKHIRAAVKKAISAGWRLTQSQGHVWGQLWCPERSRDGCIIRVFSTPANPENHARFILRRVDTCPHS